MRIGWIWGGLGSFLTPRGYAQWPHAIRQSSAGRMRGALGRRRLTRRSSLSRQAGHPYSEAHVQTLVQVICSPGRSVRDAIANDVKLESHNFEVVRERKAGRSPGWTKLRSRAEARRGSINIQWNAAAKVLSCRVVNKGSGKPNLIIGDFVDYMLQRHRRRVKFITVFPD